MTEEEQSIEKHIQKHMGCMAGFLQLFDRHHIATTKRLYSPKSLPSSSPATEMTSTSESEKSMPPPPPPSPPPTAAESIPPKSPLPLTLLNSGAAKSTWKFGREAPRLSLDSRAVTDSKGCLHPKEIPPTTTTITTATNEENQQHRSPSVIARLMGLEPSPPITSSSSTDAEPELRRSASESRATKEYLFYSRFEDFNSSNLLINAGGFKDNKTSSETDPIRTTASSNRNNIIKLQAAAKFQQQHRKCFFDSGDIFPEPKKTNVSPRYGEEIENRLRMRGMNQPSKDLETLRQILEALQLKGLLHSRDQIGRRNYVYDESSPTVVVKSPKSSAYLTPINRRIGSCDYSPKNTKSQPRRSYGRIAGEISPSVSPRRERNTSSPVRTCRSDINRRSNSLVKPKPLSVDTQRRASEAAENRRVSPVHSPKVNYLRRTGPDHSFGSNRSPRSKKPTTAEIYRKEKTVATIVEDESPSVSECSYSTSTDTERSKSEKYYKDGRNLLERCGKLLHSIAEMTSTDMQPSPVSVLDSSFYKDESFTPSPVTTRRNIEFKDHSGELEDVEPWSPAISPKCEEAASQDSDYTYISHILRASRYLPEQYDVFALLEKHQYYLNGKDTIAKVSKLQRKLIFGVINEIIERNKRLPPWKAVSSTDNGSSIDKIWSEFRKLRDRNNADDLFETICGVLKKDLAGDALNGWGDCYAEISDSILDIERMIFKDLISECIRDLATFSRCIVESSSPTLPRRKLIF